jgi:hypothetical protein
LALLPPATISFPDSTVENLAGDWVGWVMPAPGRTVLAAETTGAQAAWFEAVLTPRGAVRVEQAFVFDREAFAPGPDPWLEIGVRLRFAEGWVELAPQPVRLLDRDDTPPFDLRFAWGGQVLETHVGGEIGRLVASDPDTPAEALRYRVAWPDEAWFEVAEGDVLRLRQGVDLLREGGTWREVMVIVSDGAREVAMTVVVEVLNVTDLDDLPAPPPVVHAPPVTPVDPEPPPAPEPPSPPPEPQPVPPAAPAPEPPPAVEPPPEPPQEPRPPPAPVPAEEPAATPAAPPLAPIAAVFWSRGELRPALLVSPADAAPGTPAEAWLAAVTRLGLVILDTNRDGRFTPADHLLDLGRSAWTTPPDELAPGGEARIATPAEAGFALLLLDRGGGAATGESFEPGSASSDWFS